MKNCTMQESSGRNYQSSNTKKFLGGLLLSLLLLLGLVPKQIDAAPIVIGVDPFTPTIQAFDAATWLPASGPVLLTMPPFVVAGAQSVTWNSDNLVFYAIVREAVSGDRHFATVDPATGVCASLGVMNARYSSLTYNSDLGIMYAMGGSGSGIGFAQTLFSVSLIDGSTTFLGGPYPVGGFGEVIAYNYDDDLIYHWSGDAPANMETISPVTFLATPVIQTGAVHAEIQGAVYIGASAHFVATDLVFMGPTNGYTITPAGFVTLVGPTPYQVRGLGFVDAVLPVELASFVSSISGNAVTLNWSTSSETNNSGFDIERSIVNGQWSMIGNVTGNGTTTSQNNYSFTDRNLASGIYSYRLKQIDFNGNFEYFNLSSEVNIGVPTKFDLSQNYPNPFNPATTINYDLPFDGKVSIKLFDMSGKEVATLVNEVKTAGFYSVNFNAGNLSSGVYLYSITSNNFTATKKMMLVK